MESQDADARKSRHVRRGRGCRCQTMKLYLLIFLSVFPPAGYVCVCLRVCEYVVLVVIAFSLFVIYFGTLALSHF